jgi:DNA-binding transcriptional LysR family regulator
MEDLNDYVYFSQVVAHGGFAAAGRALNIPKSKLSRRVAGLEERLGARLIERSSHRFRVTEIGVSFYDRCRTMLAEAERAKAVVCEANGEPQGPVRLSVPLGLIDVSVAAMLPEFLSRYPRVQLQVLATDRRIDLVNERIHVAIRARTTPDTETDLMMRVLGRARRILVASPALAQRIGPCGDISNLATVPTVSMSDPVSEWVEDDTWQFLGPEQKQFTLQHRPRLMCRSVPTLLAAVKAGTGVGLLLEHVCAQDLNEGNLVRLLPDWHTVEGTIYLVFTTARGLPPAVRALIDFLVERFKSEEYLSLVSDVHVEPASTVPEAETSRRSTDGEEGFLGARSKAEMASTYPEATISKAN